MSTRDEYIDVNGADPPSAISTAHNSEANKPSEEEEEESGVEAVPRGDADVSSSPRESSAIASPKESAAASMDDARDDFFTLLTKAQSGRIDAQRCFSAQLLRWVVTTPTCAHKCTRGLFFFHILPSDPLFLAHSLACRDASPLHCNYSRSRAVPSDRPLVVRPAPPPARRVSGTLRRLSWRSRSNTPQPSDKTTIDRMCTYYSDKRSDSGPPEWRDDVPPGHVRVATGVFMQLHALAHVGQNLSF